MIFIESCLNGPLTRRDRKSTRLNSSHLGISYAVFCLKKKKNNSALQYPHDRTSPLLCQRRARPATIACQPPEYNPRVDRVQSLQSETARVIVDRLTDR